MISKSIFIVLAAPLLAAVVPASVISKSPHPLASRVLVVNNIRFADSIDVANYYMSQRGIPEANRCSIDLPDIDDISGATYHSEIKAPIQACLDRLGRGTILYIVFTPMSPIRMVDAIFTQGVGGFYYRAIDSMVANIWTADEAVETDNPYSASKWSDPGSQANVYAPFVSLADFRTTNPEALVYSVWRLDAPSAALAKGLVDKAMTAEANGLSGQGCFDRRYPDPLGADENYTQGDWDIQRAHETVLAAGFSSTLDVNDAEFGAAPAPARCDGAAFYVGWYSYGIYREVFTWATGAMGWHYDSLSLRSPRDPTNSWGAGAIANGITITAGSVAEPYLEYLPHYDGFLKNVLAGAVVGDAMLRNTEMLQWQIVYAGDPLYRPFAAASPPNVVQNGAFDNGLNGWQQFALPDLNHIVSSVTNGVLEFYPVLPAPGFPSQAAVFQTTGLSVPAGGALNSQFDIGNSSPVRKRLSVLVLAADFSDLSVCTFWLPPNAALATYEMRTHTTQAWANAAIYFYAATPGSDGGAYQLDNVSMQVDPAGTGDHTDCLDAHAPQPLGGPDGPELLTNGSFEAGTDGWSFFGSLTKRVSGGIFEFYRPSFVPDPAGVILQSVTSGLASGEVLTAQFALGNSSGVRKRVTVLLHDQDFSDLSACTFWLAPGQPLSSYVMRAYATKPWAHTTISIYSGTVGDDAWMRLDNVSLRKTPGAPVTGTTCVDPGGT